MKKIILFALLLCFSTAWAECPAWDYQEMKEMSAQELAIEYCRYGGEYSYYVKNRASIQSSINSAVSLSIESRGIERQGYNAEVDRYSDTLSKNNEYIKSCQMQIGRIKRIYLTKKTTENELNEACSKK